jgi:hypothetical protein
MAGYTVNITETQNIITATSDVNTVDITAYDQLFTITNNVQVFTATSFLQTTTIYTDAIELLVDDFANYFRGDWVDGTTYRRGELVNNRYSLFVCSTGTLTTLTSVVEPSLVNNTNLWTRVVWNEAPRSHLTITNYLNVGTTATVTGNTNIGGNAGITGNLEVTGTTHLVGAVTMDTPLDHLTVTNHLSAGSLSVGSVDGVGLTINSTATFNGQSIFNSTATFNDDVDMSSADLVVNTLRVIGVTDSGSLIVQNNALVSGNLTVTNTATILGSLNVGDITGNGGVSIAGSLRVLGTSTFSTSTINGPLVLNNTGTFNDNTYFNSTATFTEINTPRLKVAGLLYPVNTGSFGQVIANFGNGYAEWRNLGDLNFWSLSDNLFTNGYNIDTGGSSGGGYPSLEIKRAVSKIALNDDGANQSINLYAPGIIKLRVGETYTTFGSSGLSSNGSAGFTGGGSFGGNVSIAGILSGSNSDYGGRLRIGSNGFEFSDGTRLNTALPDLSDILPVATSSILGGVKIGNNINVTAEGVISVAAPYTLPIASGSSLGGIKIGSGLSIDVAGVVSVASTITVLTTSTVSLGQDMYTNGYAIRNNSITYPNAFIRLSGSGYGSGSIEESIRLDADRIYLNSRTDIAGMLTAGDITSTGGLAVNAGLLVNNTSTVITSPYIRLGARDSGHTDIGELRVKKIYNYAGTYAPFFPAGIQLADQTVQVTAYFPDGGPLPAV